MIEDNLMKMKFILFNLPNPSCRLGPGVYLASNRNEYQKHKKIMRSKAWPTYKAENLTTICEPTVWTMYDPQYLEIL
jgi:hypothetical protein